MKTKKLAHIVPVPHLEQTASNHYHMCLAHLVLQNEEYAAFYRKMSEQGKYVLMDNGAAENSQIGVVELLQAYHLVKPTEMVLPDTLSNGVDTYRKTVEGIQFFKLNNVTCKFMAVPQGLTLSEWIQSAKELIELSDVDTLGVSKFLTITTEDPYIRVQASKALTELNERLIVNGRKPKEIHLLGCHTGPDEVRAVFANEEAGRYVRGCDTALGYLYAQAGVDMVLDSVRPKGEIEFIDGEVDSDILAKTLRAFDEITEADQVETKSWKGE